jgi:integrase
LPTLKLTDAAVRRFKAKKGQRVEYFDTWVRGLALRVSGPIDDNPSIGNKTWVVYYRVGGRLRRYTIGKYSLQPDAGWSLSKARREAGAALAAAQVGEDRAALKRAKRDRAANLIQNVVDEFLLRYMEGKKRSPGYIADTRAIFENHVLPRWRGREISSISRRDVVVLLDAIVDRPKKKDSDRRLRGGPIAANRTLAAVRKLMNWSLQRGLIETSPAGAVEKPAAETRRERTLAAEEVQRLWPHLEALAYPIGHFFQMALTTGQRREEVATMRWADVDETDRVWVIPGERTKSGRPHIVPLSPLAIEVLASCRAAILNAWDQKLGPYVFTVSNEGPITGYSKGKDKLDIQSTRALEFLVASHPQISLRPSATRGPKTGTRRVRLVTEGAALFAPEHAHRMVGIRHGQKWGYARITRIVSSTEAEVRVLLPFGAAAPSNFWLLGGPPWTIHDLRRTCATGMGKLGVSRFIIGRVLSHADRSVTGIYDQHEYLAEKRHALESWAAYLRNLVAAPGANVTQLRG